MRNTKQISNYFTSGEFINTHLLLDLLIWQPSRIPDVYLWHFVGILKQYKAGLKWRTSHVLIQTSHPEKKELYLRGHSEHKSEADILWVLVLGSCWIQGDTDFPGCRPKLKGSFMWGPAINWINSNNKGEMKQSLCIFFFFGVDRTEVHKQQTSYPHALLTWWGFEYGCQNWEEYNCWVKSQKESQVASHCEFAQIAAVSSKNRIWKQLTTI